MNYKKPAFWLILVAVLLCAAIAVCFLTDPKAEILPVETTAPTEKAESAAEVTEIAETAAPAQVAAPVHQEVADLAWFMELAAFEKEFQNMSPERQTQIIQEYGGLLDGYDILARESTDGTLFYIVGCWPGDPVESPLYHLRSEITEDENGTVQGLYDLRELEGAEKYVELEYKYTTYHSCISHASATGYFLIHSMDSGRDFRDVFNKYQWPNGREYLLDAVSRGISIGTPQGPYLEVSLISPQWGEISEVIALTDEQFSQILAEPRQEIEKGWGFMAHLEPAPYSSVDYEFESLNYTEFLGVPQTVLDLAVEKCGCQFASPRDIQSDIVEARLDCDWLTEPLYASEADLPQLQSILKSAEFGYVGACGYGAKLTVTMADGTELVTYKGTDNCDTMVFGSFGGYFIGDDENIEFWYLFGLDPNSKQPLS